MREIYVFISFIDISSIKITTGHGVPTFHVTTDSRAVALKVGQCGIYPWLSATAIKLLSVRLIQVVMHWYYACGDTKPKKPAKTFR